MSFLEFQLFETYFQNFFILLVEKVGPTKSSTYFLNLSSCLMKLGDIVVLEIASSSKEEVYEVGPLLEIRKALRIGSNFMKKHTHRSTCVGGQIS